MRSTNSCHCVLKTPRLLFVFFCEIICGREKHSCVILYQHCMAASVCKVVYSFVIHYHHGLHSCVVDHDTHCCVLLLCQKCDKKHTDRYKFGI